MKNTCLHGDLNEAVYMQPFPMISHPSSKVSLQCAQYGLKQALRAWFTKFNSTISSLGFASSSHDFALVSFSMSVIYMII